MPTWPYFRVLIEGPSMESTLRAGEWWIARRQDAARPGDIVVVEQPGGSGLLMVKRLVRMESSGYWVEGDNPGQSRDSRHFGPVDARLIRGRLVLRYWPLPVGRPARSGG